MREPTPLVEDPDASEELRRALALAQQIPPGTYDVERGLERHRAAVAAAVALAGASGTAARQTAWRLGAGYFRLAVVGAASVLVATVYLTTRGRPAPEPVERTDVAPATIDAPRGTIPEPSAPEPPAASTETATPAPTPFGPSIETQPAPTSAPARRTTSPPRLDDDELLRAETANLARVRATLESDPAAALRLALDGHREYRSGMFFEERESYVIRALAALGRADEAHARAERYVVRYPRGPHTRWARAILDGAR